MTIFSVLLIPFLISVSSLTLALACPCPHLPLPLLALAHPHPHSPLPLLALTLTHPRPRPHSPLPSPSLTLALALTHPRPHPFPPSSLALAFIAHHHHRLCHHCHLITSTHRCSMPTHQHLCFSRFPPVRSQAPESVAFLPLPPSLVTWGTSPNSARRHRSALHLHRSKAHLIASHIQQLPCHAPHALVIHLATIWMTEEKGYEHQEQPAAHTGGRIMHRQGERQ